MNNNKTWIAAGGIFGFLGVAIGAFGAHGLKDYLTPEMVEVYKTGVLYQLVHSAVILSIGFYGDKDFRIPALLFTIGILLFSFSLYFYALTYTIAFAIITPFGGICLLAGWLMVIVAAVRKKG